MSANQTWTSRKFRDVTLGVVIVLILMGAVALHGQDRPATAPVSDPPSQPAGKIANPKSSAKDPAGKVRAQTNIRIFIPDAQTHIPTSPFERKDGD